MSRTHQFACDIGIRVTGGGLFGGLFHSSYIKAW